ncbi:hypothetical protein BH23GEM1_BH23GEM1_06150 [soil metagenome]
MRNSPATLLLVLLLSGVAEAQSAPVGVGARIRVTVPGTDMHRHVTTVAELRGDSIVVAGKSRVRTIALRDVTELGISTGSRTQVVRDGLIGFGAGAGLGFILGAMSYEEPDFLVGSAGEAGAMVGAVFGVVGLVAGGVVGAMHRTDRWEPARMPVRASIAPSRSGGVNVGVSKAF